MEDGSPLMQVLRDRRSLRAFSAEKLPMQVLSNMLWAACGVNHPESGRRTAPSAVNWQEIDVYVATSDGLYRYDAKGHFGISKKFRNDKLRALKSSAAQALS